MSTEDQKTPARITCLPRAKSRSIQPKYNLNMEHTYVKYFPLNVTNYKAKSKGKQYIYMETAPNVKMGKY